ncbi:hypothetical protein KSP39_PZI016586 [Platanthera zijinensis]|uniref:Aldose 1-epimerase n=1 Tax=Platanthera zijinensis TaxID=2320716 RepID=A0AAP0G142_9ASPA
MVRSEALLLLSLLALSLSGASTAAPRETVGIYELKKGDFSVKITNWGATILSLIFPDSRGQFTFMDFPKLSEILLKLLVFFTVSVGNLADVVLGYEGIRPYINGTTYFGALVGRVGGRISGSRFVLNGTAYRLYRNDGTSSIHGGHRGFSFVIWTVEEKVDGEFPYIKLYYHSFDKEQGDLDVYVTYKITAAYELSITMEATARTKATPVNLLQHSYWNLGGHSSGTILSNTVQIFASRITPLDDHFLPTGAFASVSGTPFDFRSPMTVESRFGEVKGGYNLNYVVDGHGMRKAAAVKDGRSGRALELWANQPALTFYTANFLENVEGKGGVVYGKYAGLCLETMGYPDAVNRPEFPSVIVNPGEVYRHDMLFKFSF